MREREKDTFVGRVVTLQQQHKARVRGSVRQMAANTCSHTHGVSQSVLTGGWLPTHTPTRKASSLLSVGRGGEGVRLNRLPPSVLTILASRVKNTKHSNRKMDKNEKSHIPNTVTVQEGSHEKLITHLKSSFLLLEPEKYPFSCQVLYVQDLQMQSENVPSAIQ